MPLGPGQTPPPVRGKSVTVPELGEMKPISELSTYQTFPSEAAARPVIAIAGRVVLGLFPASKNVWTPDVDTRTNPNFVFETAPHRLPSGPPASAVGCWSVPENGRRCGARMAAGVKMEKSAMTVGLGANVAPVMF